MLASDPRRRPTAIEVQAAARKLAHSLYRGSSIELPFKLQAKLWLQKPSNRILLGVQVLLAVAGILSYLFLRDGDSSDAKAAPTDEATETAPAAAAPKKAAPAPEMPAKAAPLPEAPKKAAPLPEAPKKHEAVKTPAPRTHTSAPAAAPKAPAPKAPVVAPRAPVAEPKAPAAEPPRDRDAPIKDPFGEM
jgi:hypothetical protein